MSTPARVSWQDVAPSLSNRLSRFFTRATLTSDTALLVYLGLLDFVVHMAVAGNYGYFRDELYYIIGGRHLSFGYVDYPPLISWLAALLGLASGDALVILHIVPALAIACLVVVTGLIARELGGGRLAQLLAALATSVSLVFLALASIFTMDPLDELWWGLGAYLVVRSIRRQQPRLWLLFGLVAGVGLLTKLSMLFFGLAITAALLLTPERRVFRTRWPWLGGAIALAFLLPYLLWNWANGFPTWEFWHHYGGFTGGGPVGFVANQLFLMNPVTVPLWVAGLVFYFRAPAGKPYRVMGWTYVILYALFTVVNFKPYFLAPAYPMLYAGGAMMFEQLAQRPRRVWVTPAYIVALALSGLLFLPFTTPLLPPATYVRTFGFLTGAGNSAAGQANAGQFPQPLGDRFGWDTMTVSIAKVYAALPSAQRAQACIFTGNYGEASALTFFGDMYHHHLPPVISGHNNYYLWGPGRCSGRVMITVGVSRADLASAFTQVTLAATNTCTYCMSGENNLPVYVCTQPTVPIPDLWPMVKHFD
jgi:Dolichyl-phosphate-mannose-protein mannosyltransferase